MKKALSLIMLGLLIIVSCDTQESENNETAGTPTTIRGTVSDNFRNTKVANFKLVLLKTKSCWSGVMSAICSEEVATVYTDENGEYTINFNYKLEEGESYSFQQVYYGDPYTAEITYSNGIKEGAGNVWNVNAYKPVTVKINIDVKNNNTKPLITGIEYDNINQGTENIYEEETSKTLTFKVRPNSDVTINFWYNENYNSSNPTRHLITVPYTTTLEDVTELDFDIDCATF